MITLCVPTRGRADRFHYMLRSAIGHAVDPTDIQVVFYVAANDPQGDLYPQSRRTIAGARLLRLDGDHVWNSVAWNLCCAAGDGPIYMQAADDLDFRTVGWDAQLRAVFEHDPFAMAHFPDGTAHDVPQPRTYLYHDGGSRSYTAPFAAHVTVGQSWVDAVGYLVPQHFPSTFTDMWVNELADRLKQRYVLDGLVEHHHPAWGTRPADTTDAIRITADDLYQPGRVYVERSWEREQDYLKLRDAIAAAERAVAT